MTSWFKESDYAPIVIYLLKDPRDLTPKYVGSTKNLPQRLYAHLGGLTPATKDWIKEIRALGLEKQFRECVEVLCNCHKEDRKVMEDSYIDKYWRENPNSLLNEYNPLRKARQRHAPHHNL